MKGGEEWFTKKKKKTNQKSGEGKKRRYELALGGELLNA